jgi:hypothetical protein
MGETPNGPHSNGSMTDPRGSCGPSPIRADNPAGSQPPLRTPTPEQILFIALSAGSLAHVATPPLNEYPRDPHYQMMIRPEIRRCANQIKDSFGTLWGLRDFPIAGWPEEIRERLLYIYNRFHVMYERFDRWYEVYGRPEFAPTPMYKLAEPLPWPSDDEDEPTEPVMCFEANEDLARTKRVRDHEIGMSALRKSYTGEAADRMFFPFEDEEMMAEIHAAAQNLITLVWNECSPAWRGPEDQTALPDAQSKGNDRPEATGRNPEAPTRPLPEPVMSGIVHYRPLDGLGEVRLDLDACPRRIPLFSQDRDCPDFPQIGVVDSWLHLTPEGRWVEHTWKYLPFDDGDPYEDQFREVSPDDGILVSPAISNA